MLIVLLKFLFSWYLHSIVISTLFKSEDIQSMTLSAARKYLKSLTGDFKLPSDFNAENFRECANGVFQAEGHISCRIRGNYFSPNFAIVQNLTPESLNFFITLWHVLGRTSNLSITRSKSGLLVIRLSSENWKVILETNRNYFSSIYGEKFIAFFKLADIRRLSQLSDPYSLTLAVQLVYSLATSGTNRVLSLSEQCDKLGLKSDMEVEIPKYADNFITPSILFLIGFIIGDGTLFIRLRAVEKGSI